jgi:hypothetical protein
MPGPAEASDHRLAPSVARRVDRVSPARWTAPPAAVATEERGGSRLAQGNYFGGRIAEAKLPKTAHTPASHLTQGWSNEDIPVKQCSYFQKQSSMFFTHQLGHALAHSCKCRCKGFERNPCQIQPSFAPSKSEFFPGPRPSSSSWGKVNGGT